MQSVTPINTVNNTLNFYPADGNWEVARLPFKASVEITDGYLVSYEVSGSNPTGYLTLAAGTSANGQNIVGILQEKITSTDTDYATAGKLKNVLIPKSKRAQARFKATAGTLTAADVGRICNIHTDSAGLAVDTNGLGAQITGYIDSSYGLCTFDVPLAVTA
jgi:hypothetical protein